MERFATLAGVLAAGGPGDWSLPAVTAPLGRGGCVVSTTPTGRVEVSGAGDVQVEVVRDPDVADPAAPGAVYGVGLVPPGRDLRAAVAAAAGVLGPPPTVGGPGPWARWPGAAVWWTLARSPGTGTLRLFAEPAGRAAEDERRDVGSGTLRSLPYTWRLDDEALLPAGCWLPPSRPEATSARLGDQLGAVCAGLVEAVREFDQPGVVLTLTTRKGRDAVTVDVAGGALTVDTGTPRRFAADGPGAVAAAAAVHDAVAAWAVRRPAKDLRWTARTGSGHRVSLPALGVAAGP